MAAKTTKTAKASKAGAAPDVAVRAAAAELAAAIHAAQAAGYVVTWPARPEGLAAIAVSETGKVRKQG